MRLSITILTLLLVLMSCKNDDSVYDEYMDVIVDKDVLKDENPDQDKEMICEPNSITCYNEDSVLICDETGYSQRWEECDPGVYCDWDLDRCASYEDPEGEVEDNFDEDTEQDDKNHDIENSNVPDQDQICIPNTTTCYTDYVVLICDENGFAKEWIPCGENEICDHRDYNECRTIICEANDGFCENNSVYRCDSFGVEKDLIEECLADQDCIEGIAGAECHK